MQVYVNPDCAWHVQGHCFQMPFTFDSHLKFQNPVLNVVSILHLPLPFPTDEFGFFVSEKMKAASMCPSAFSLQTYK